MVNTYFIGGSPCSGKSTVAEVLAKKYDLYYFKVDDFLDEYLERGKEAGKTIAAKLASLSNEETWMRAPDLQSQEELEYYREIFEFIREDLEKITGVNGILTEGAAYLPELMKKAEISDNHYISMTPTKAFQVSHYKERPWIPYVLEGCSDKEQAFLNWMERDALFAEEIRKQCQIYGYEAIVTDGSEAVEEVMKRIENILFERNES